MSKNRKPSQDDIMRLGPRIAAIKAKADPKAWRHMVKRAHAGGFTVAGELSGQPDALKERRQSSLKQQAQHTIAAAYRPAQVQIAGDQAKLAAYDAKRKQDNASYETWMAAQRQKQDATLAGAASLISQQEQQLANDTHTQWAQASGNAQANVAAQNGVVSDMSQSKALDFGAAAARGNQMVDNARQSTDALMSAGIEQQRGTNQAMLAQAGAREAQRYADTQASRTQLLDQKSKLAVAKAGDVLKEFTRLQDAEVSKANANRDYSALTERLGIQQAGVQLDVKKFRHSVKQDNRTAHQRAQDIAIRKGKLLLDQGKADLNSDGVVDGKDYKLKKKIDAKAVKDGRIPPGKKGPSAGEKSTSVDKIGALSRVYALLTDLHSRYDPQAGGKPDAKHNPGTFRHILTGSLKGGASSIMIDLAEDARTHGGRLSPAGIRKAREIGILHPEKIRL